MMMVSEVRLSSARQRARTKENANAFAGFHGEASGTFAHRSRSRIDRARVESNRIESNGHTIHLQNSRNSRTRSKRTALDRSRVTPREPCANSSEVSFFSSEASRARRRLTRATRNQFFLLRSHNHTTSAIHDRSFGTTLGFDRISLTRRRHRFWRRVRRTLSLARRRKTPTSAREARVRPHRSQPRS